ncbi:MMPL family transporter [Streptacidiphilus sp. P02-A3a]|uniref:MMPL family transporter n=1 Tax=Streptacidiphilus sp. P02-A3a TaxID=2704468 RepID=UPI0015F7F62D|nr:MMPL family transporter [Streptacidiphilus sp. P02-A3a]QMU69674.1 MMPL family transporter [Streptacidiphilus sp. P02-A3a]
MTSRTRARRSPRPGLAAAVGGWSARHRKTAVFGWLLFVVLATVLGGMTGSLQTTDQDNGLGQSGRADQMIARAGITSPASESVLIRSGAFTATDPRFRSAVDDAVAAIRATGETSSVRSPYSSGAIAPDRHSALVEITMSGDPDTADQRVAPVLTAVASVQARHPGLTVQEFGDASANKWFNDTFSKDFSRAEWTAVPLALGILLVAFGALVAAVLPVVLALTAFVAATGLVALSSHILHTSDDASSVMLLVGLAVGVDYCLFYLRREREERANGHSAADALRIAAATSGRSVMVSGLTVCVAMAGMFLTGIADFMAMGMATIIVVVTAVLGSVTVLPALLSKLGDRVAKGRLPLLGRRQARGTGGNRVWRAVLGRVLRRPLVAAGLAAGLLLALAVPVLTMHTANLTFAQQLPKGSPLVVAEQDIAAAFPGNPNQATVVVRAADLGSPALASALTAFEHQAVSTGLMRDPITVTKYPAQHLELLYVPLAGSGNDRTSDDALAALRGPVLAHTLNTVPGTQTAVTGDTAESADFNSQMSGSLLPVFAFVMGFAFLLMLLSFRSVVIAATALGLNLLSVAASYGALTLIFQHGVGASLVGSSGVGAIETWVPLFLFVILFGLSMDYHVFVVSRMKEAHDRGLDTRSAVAHGITSTAGTVTSAAVIMIAVFAVFGTLDLQSMKQMGIGLAVAVLIDATVIRAVLLPSVMTLLGDRNWYLPRWLRWLPDLGHEQPSPAPAPTDQPRVTTPSLI